MSKEKPGSVAGIDYTVKEFKIDDVLNALDQTDRPLTDRAKELFEQCTDFPLEKYRSLTFSEVRKVYDDIKEVNSDFFEMAQMMGLEKQMITEVVTYAKEVIGDFDLSFFEQSGPDTDKQENTDGPTS